MATAPIFVATPKIALSTVTTANTARDGTGTLTTAFTAGANGSRVERITVTASVTTAAGTITIFVSDGTNNRLYREITVLVTTASTTSPAWSGTVSLGLILPAGYSVKVGTNVATGQPFNVVIEGGDF
ncbi:hypothetical protein [Paracraurococcus lichenis]|uniref:Uncharacterized protein n=1 Tax=Paracraurococcus lichenis TaxID=3064888 RepID=A0ABT9E4D9_9PROT|nr:hypothetical protein [Paracraurococcus sp. LOR1-02]MDO9711036.1 hypothetical protein [Paracraurococcus sp. LOR1-02]